MRQKLLFYHVDTEYINYLKKYQEHIWDNDDKGHIRPHIGIVLEINNFKYYAPLSSPKLKHKNMDERLDFIKVENKKGLMAVINLNNIIPVNDHNITIVNLEINEDEDEKEKKYKRLLFAESKIIRKKKDLIIDSAKSVYEKVTKYPDENSKLVKICYDFKLLEEKCVSYETQQEVASTEEDINKH